MQHDLKMWPVYFCAVVSGYKRFELRLNDRNFQVGDTITLREWHQGKYTGRTYDVEVRYVLRLKEYGDIKGIAWKIARLLMPDLVILSIEEV